MSALEYTMTHESASLSKVWDDGTIKSNPLYLHEIDNLLIKKTSYPEFTREYSRTIGGPSFFVSIYENQFYHFLSDGIAQYLWLRTFIPELKIYFINDQPAALAANIDAAIKKDFVARIVEWCQEEGYGGEVIDLVRYKKLKVDKLFVMANSIITFLREGIKEFRESKVVGDVSNSDGARSLMLPLLKEFIYKKALEKNRLPEDFTYPERVFLRPGLTYERLMAWQDQIDYLKNHRVIFDKDMNIVDDPENVVEIIYNLDYWRHTIDVTSSSNLRGVVQELEERYLSRDEIQLLDSFFERRDYYFLDSEEMSWLDMLNIIIRAKKVALISGAAILNAMIAESETQIIYVEPNTTYRFNHIEILNIFFKDVEPIIYYNRNEVTHKKFDVTRLLKDLEQEKGDLI